MNPTRNIFVANIRFHGLFGSGYATVNVSISGTWPFTIPAVICALSTVKLYKTSYRQIITKPNNISCSNAILHVIILVVRFQPILETQYHPIIVEKKSQVVTFAKFSKGISVVTNTSPITYVPFSSHSSYIA